jgi:hypothetical protein
MDKGPIFIGGPDRSGKTLLRLALSLHPQIGITKRTDLWTRFYGRYGDLERSDNFERCISAILAYKHIQVLQPDGRRLRSEFSQGEPTYARLFALIHEQYSERLGKPRWGDQSELVERYADPIFAAYPSAKIIHLVRDPLDRFSASKSRWKRGKGKVGVATARWVEAADLALRNLQRYPDQCMIVQYEALVMRPEVTLSEVCSFLGEEYAPAMLLIGHTPTYADEIVRPPNGVAENHFLTQFIGNYYLNLSDAEIAFIQSSAGRDMLAFGYALRRVNFSLSERLSYWVRTWPVNVLSMLAWRATKTLGTRFPGPGQSGGGLKGQRVAHV